MGLRTRRKRWDERREGLRGDWGGGLAVPPMGRDTIPISVHVMLRDSTSGGVYQHPPFVTPAVAVWVKIPVSICLAWVIPYGRQRHPYGGGEAFRKRPRGVQNGAKNSVFYGGPRVSSGPLRMAHSDGRKAKSINGLKKRGPRGPPMAHRKCGEWATGNR